jgi:hypothetical protein
MVNVVLGLPVSAPGPCAVMVCCLIESTLTTRPVGYETAVVKVAARAETRSDAGGASERITAGAGVGWPDATGVVLECVGVGVGATVDGDDVGDGVPDGVSWAAELQPATATMTSTAMPVMDHLRMNICSRPVCGSPSYVHLVDACEPGLGRRSTAFDPLRVSHRSSGQRSVRSSELNPANGRPDPVRSSRFGGAEALSHP